MLIVKIGGPAYRIGMGGGAASSVPSGGSSRAELDFNAVQVLLCSAYCWQAGGTALRVSALRPAVLTLDAAAVMHQAPDMPSGFSSQAEASLNAVQVEMCTGRPTCLLNLCQAGSSCTLQGLCSYACDCMRKCDFTLTALPTSMAAALLEHVLSGSCSTIVLSSEYCLPADCSRVLLKELTNPHACNTTALC